MTYHEVRVTDQTTGQTFGMATQGGTEAEAIALAKAVEETDPNLKAEAVHVWRADQ